MVRLISYTITTDPIKRMRVRTFGKKTSKVKTEHEVLRRAEPVFEFGKMADMISNAKKFNAHNKEFDTEFGWLPTQKVNVVRGLSRKLTIQTDLSNDVLNDVNALLRQVLLLKQITHADMLKTYMAFDNTRKANLERVRYLLAQPRLTPERIKLLRKLKQKWLTSKAHCRYRVSTEVYYDFGNNNNAHDIRGRATKIHFITVDEVFEDGGVFFNRKEFAKLKAWIDINFFQLS